MTKPLSTKANQTILKTKALKPLRWYQYLFHDALINKGYKRAICLWHRRCLSGDTHIIMADGSWKFLKDVQVGDKILSFNGQHLEEDEVIDHWQTEEQETFIGQSRSCPSIVCSSNHRFATIGDLSQKNHNWYEFQDIKPHRAALHYLGCDSGAEHHPELAEFLGYIICDGYVSGYQQPKFTNNNKDILLRFEELAKKLFDIDVIWRKKGNAYDLGLSNGTKGGGYTKNPVKEFLKQYDLCKPKSLSRLPSIVWEFDKESLGRFLSGVISADGCIYTQKRGREIDGKKIPKKSEIKFSVGVCEDCAWDYYWLLRKFGVFPAIPQKDPRHSCWYIRVWNECDIKELLSYGPIYGKEDAQKTALENSKKFKERGKWKDFARKRLNKSGPHAKQHLYDITTKKNSNFIANGYLVHNCGKDFAAWQHALFCATNGTPKLIYYIAPTYSQAKKIIWQGMTEDGERFIDMAPKELVSKVNHSEMRIDFKTGSSIHLVGSDRYDSLRGTNPNIVIFSEYGMMNPLVWENVISPILLKNGGTAIFISTPFGKNHFYDLWVSAKEDPDWFCMKITADDSGLFSKEELEKERKRKDEAIFEQEFYCSFNRGLVGGIYQKHVDQMISEKRVCSFPWEPMVNVDVSFDLGISDSTVIIYFQQVGREVRILESEEVSGESLEYIVKKVREKKYIINRWFFPHDLSVRELSTGISRADKLREFGVEPIILPQLSIYGGIEQVKSLMLSRLWINEPKNKMLIKALESYHRSFDEKTKILSDKPVHDWSSHWCDSLRYLAVGLAYHSEEGIDEEQYKRLSVRNRPVV